MKYVYNKYICTEGFEINDVLVGNKGDVLEIIDATPIGNETLESVKGYCDIKNLNTNQGFNAIWNNIDDSLKLIEENELLIYNGKAREWTDLDIDVCSPQECADLFGKPVKDGDIIYYPKTNKEVD